jgi:sortase (surface protein transpeptidase)
MVRYLKIWGYIWLVIGVLGIASVYLPLVFQEARYRVDAPSPETVQSQSAAAAVQETLHPFEHAIYVPKIGALSKVISNVDPTNEQEYLLALQNGVAIASQQKPLFLFAHSAGSELFRARYNAVFYLLNKLEKDDEFFIKQDGVVQKYTVTRITEVAPEEVGAVQNNSDDAVLMTCTPPGTTLRRLLIFGKKTEM